MIHRPVLAMKFYEIMCCQVFSANMKMKFSIGQEKKWLENSRFSALMNFLISLEAGWGPLHLEKTSKDEAFYSLKNDFGTNTQNRSCQLEAGFIAEQYQKFNGLLTECYGESNAKDGLVHFQVKWDLKTKIEV